MLSTIEVEVIVDRVAYKRGWEIHVGGKMTEHDCYLQVSVDASVGVDSVTGDSVAWKGGKKYLSPHMCSQEIIGACFAIIKEAEEHEMREWFRYKGASIFNPHLDPEALVEVAKYKENFVTRDDGSSMNPQ